MAEGYSTSGSQANSVALNPGGTFSGGKRFSVSGPVFGGSFPARGSQARATRAHAAGCYGSPSSQWTWWVAGATAGWVYVRQNGWCGSGGVIWNLGGYATFASWSWGPFCLTSKGAAYSWDVWPSWVHMAHWATFGLSYPWGCCGYSGGKAPLRIAWNGYWDRDNDVGF